METRQLAEQVLFGTSLADKLIDGGAFVDKSPGSGIATPERPGRPSSLELASWDSRERVRFAEVRKFHSERERGLVLHFFANHELLALELMALALLKFPLAPEPFRRGLYGTLREEQEHLRLYIERMRRVGVEFGELAVSDFFWRSISSMQSPMDFVTRLSLTLEQANLDYAPYYAGVYEKLGDGDTQRLLERIYRDEIGHVKHGLTWFNAWRDPQLSEWEAYGQTLETSLEASLNPNRAKGIGFNEEGRRQAGFSQEFIRELEIFSQSRGRCPNVFWFNPACDRNAGRDASALTAPKRVAEMQADLEALPMLLCAGDDAVLVRRRPSLDFLGDLHKAGLAIPEFVEFDGSANGLGTHRLVRRKIQKLAPWGVSPDSDELLEPLRDNLTAPESSAAWNSELRKLYSKAWGARVLREFLQGRSDDWLCESDVVGETCHSSADARAVVDKLRQRGFGRVVIKANFGAAGQDQIRLEPNEGLVGESGDPDGRQMKRWRWLERLLEEQGAVVVEPLLDGVVDLSAQYEVSARGNVSLLGITRFLTDGRGQYLGSFLHQKVAGLDEKTRRFLYGEGRDNRRLKRLYEELAPWLAAAAEAAAYSGPIGVDGLVYRRDGTLRLKPVIEVNPRFTMGRVALQLAQQVNAARTAVWLMLRTQDLRVAGFEDAQAAARHVGKQHAIEMTADGDQISRGMLFTTDPSRAQAFVTMLVVKETLAECKAPFEAWGGRLSEWTRWC